MTQRKCLDGHRPVRKMVDGMADTGHLLHKEASRRDSVQPGLLRLWSCRAMDDFSAPQPISSKIFVKIFPIHHNFQDKRVRVRYSRSEWGRGREFKRVTATA